ncbi:MAG: alpha/beta hydrolase [Candidatus Aminicenantales bacterium]
MIPRDHIRVEKDVVYAVVDGHTLTLDIAYPDNLIEPAPAIVDIPGGAWRNVRKSAEDAIWYAQQGFIGVSITHRTSDIAVFPAAVHDCKTVFRWLRSQAKKYNINPDKIGVTGFSSGGHLAVLLGTSGRDPYLEGDGGYPEYSSRVQAVVDNFGPTDFLRMNDFRFADFIDHFDAKSPESLFLGGPIKEKPELAKLANPITYIDPKDPPIWIGHGENDGMVIINQSGLLYEALKKAAVETEFVRVRNADHMYRPSPAGATVSPSVEELNKMAIDWFKKWLGEPKWRAVEDEPSATTTAAKEYKIYYEFLVDLPGKNKDSYCKGNFMMKCAGRTLVRGTIDMPDLSTQDKRTFKQEFEISVTNLVGYEILWNFQGEVFDAALQEKFEYMRAEGTEFDETIEGLGFIFRITADKNVTLEPRVYRKSDSAP